MPFETFVTFSAAMFLLALAPGPGVAAVVARALSAGLPAAFGVISGLVIGDVVFMGLALAGLSALAANAGPVFGVVKYVGAAYLLWIGYQAFTDAATSIAVPEAADMSPLRELGMGLLVTLGNPKPILFYGALMPTFLDVTKAELADGMVLAVVIATVSYGVLGGYALLAHRARRLLTTPNALRRLNQTTGAVMIGAGVAIAAR